MAYILAIAETHDDVSCSLGTHPHHVDARDVGIDAPRRVEALHLGAESVVEQHQLGRHLAGADDLAVVIDVVDEGVERLHPLRQALGQEFPFRGRDDARNDVEWNEPLGVAAVVIDGKGDAGAAEQEFGLAPLQHQEFARHFVEPHLHLPVLRQAFARQAGLVEGLGVGCRQCRGVFHSRIHLPGGVFLIPGKVCKARANSGRPTGVSRTR